MSDWAAGSQAIGEASEWIRCGEADAVLAGGTDCGVQPFAYQAYERAGWLHTGEDGTGFIPGEGSAVFLLEERGAALARGAPIRAEILAYASRTPHHQRSAAQTLAQTLCEAMTRAGWNRHNVSACTIAAPTTPLFANVSRGAIAVAVDDRSARATCDERFGFSLAAAAPIDAAVTMCTAPGGARVLSSAVGSSHEAVTLAFEVAG
jgi:3-oxoacyl-(acyl-carrier-protein) synthase